MQVPVPHGNAHTNIFDTLAGLTSGVCGCKDLWDCGSVHHVNLIATLFGPKGSNLELGMRVAGFDSKIDVVAEQLPNYLPFIMSEIKWHE